MIAARLISGREGIKVVLAGSIEPKGAGYSITVKAVDPVNGKLLTTASASSAKKGDVLGALGSVASRLRSALGDTTPESAKRVNHPAPFPVELPERLIKLFTYKDDLVLDPFLGVGASAIAAKRAGRHYVGYELDPGYAEAARRRVEATV